MLSIKNTFDMLKTSRALKMLRARTALGVDISDKRISLALLKRTKKGVELLASANAPVPDGAIANGSIANAGILADVIRNLKNKCRIRTTRAAVSLFTEPVVTQIMNIPKQIPSNIGQFVQEQVKHIAALPANNIALDFCGVAGPVRRSASEGGAGSEASSAGRLLVVAADDRKVNEIVKLCSQAELTVQAVEPPLLAYTRALYAKKVAGKFDCNTLIVILQDNTLTLCVFKKQAMDFIRTKTISRGTGEKTQPDEFSLWLAEQINAVIQFYDVEVPDSAGKWEITIVADSVQLPRNAREALKAKIAGADLQILTGEDICQAVVVSQSHGPSDCPQNEKPSPVALGLAMKLLDTDKHGLGVNLLPPEVVRLRTAQKEALITANVLASVLLIMILAVIVPEWKIKTLNERIGSKRVNLLRNAYSLFEKRESVDKQISTVNNQIKKINGILDSRSDTDWSGLLTDIAKAIPKNVCITALSRKADSPVSLKGLATSNEAVYWFVDRMNKSERVNLASIVETKRDSRGFVNYEISCTLPAVKEK